MDRRPVLFNTGAKKVDTGDVSEKSKTKKGGENHETD